MRSIALVTLGLCALACLLAWLLHGSDPLSVDEGLPGAAQPAPRDPRLLEGRPGKGCARPTWIQRPGRTARRPCGVAYGARSFVPQTTRRFPAQLGPGGTDQPLSGFVAHRSKDEAPFGSTTTDRHGAFRTGGARRTLPHGHRAGAGLCRPVHPDRAQRCLRDDSTRGRLYAHRPRGGRVRPGHRGRHGACRGDGLRASMPRPMPTDLLPSTACAQAPRRCGVGANGFATVRAPPIAVSPNAPARISVLLPYAVALGGRVVDADTHAPIAGAQVSHRSAGHGHRRRHDGCGGDLHRATRRGPR